VSVGGEATPAAWSAVDDGHVSFVVAIAGGRREIVQPFNLLGAQLDAPGGGVLLDAGQPLGAGNRGDVVARSEQPGKSRSTQPSLIPARPAERLERELQQEFPGQLP